MAQRDFGSARRGASCDRKSALPVPLPSRHQRSSSVGPNPQNVYSTPLIRQNSGVIKSSTRGTSTRKYVNMQLPIGDREFQKAAVNKVRSYFQQNSPLNISWSTFGAQPLPVAAIVQMFDFLLKKLIKDIKLDIKNYVDELPRCMKALSYPNNIQKSSLHTINTKTSWPSVLGMLVFLVDLVGMCDESILPEILCSDDNYGQEFDIQTEVFYHLLNIYSIWNNSNEGEDERKVSEANQEFKEKLKLKFDVYEKDMAALEENVKILEIELNRNSCKDLEEKVQRLQTKKNELYKDEERLQLQINKLEITKRERERQTEEKKSKILLLEESNNKKKADIQRLEELCKTQEMTVEDREKILQECMELRARIKLSEDLNSSLNTMLYKSDQETAKLKAKVDNCYKELRTFQCEKVHIPEVSEMKVESRYSLEDWTRVKVELDNLISQLVSRKLQLGKYSVELKEEVSMLKDQLDQLVEDIRNKDRHLKDLDKCQQKLRTEIKEMNAKVVEKEEEIEKNEQKLEEEKARLQHITTELENCQIEYANIISEGEKKIKDEEEYLQWMRDNLQKLKTDFIEKSGLTDFEF